MEGRESEGMREAESVQDCKDVSLCSKMLLISAHKKCKIVGELHIIVHPHTLHSQYPLCIQIVRQCSSWRQILGQKE